MLDSASKRDQVREVRCFSTRGICFAAFKAEIAAIREEKDPAAHCDEADVLRLELALYERLYQDEKGW